MLCAVLASSVLCPAADEKFLGLPKDAMVIEARMVPSRVAQDRWLVLWMREPRKNDRGPLNEVPYTCPEETTGSYWEGPTRVSLYDSASKNIINSVAITYPDTDDDAFAIPYRIKPDLYYYVPPNRVADGEGTPEILNLRDSNGDGSALEFTFYHAEACMGLGTSLVGYSIKQDRVIQYPFTLEVTTEGEDMRQETSVWIDYVLSRRPIRPGSWRFSSDYRGRGGTLDTYVIRYDAEAERFRGSRVSVFAEPR